MSNISMMDRWVSPAQAAEIIGINEQTVRRYLRAKILDGEKIKTATTGKIQRNSLWRIPMSSIDEFMQSS